MDEYLKMIGDKATDSIVRFRRNCNQITARAITEMNGIDRFVERETNAAASHAMADRKYRVSRRWVVVWSGNEMENVVDVPGTAAMNGVPADSVCAHCGQQMTRYDATKAEPDVNIQAAPGGWYCERCDFDRPDEPADDPNEPTG